MHGKGRGGFIGPLADLTAALLGMAVLSIFAFMAYVVWVWGFFAVFLFVAMVLSFTTVTVMWKHFFAWMRTREQTEAEFRVGPELIDYDDPQWATVHQIGGQPGSGIPAIVASNLLESNRSNTGYGGGYGGHYTAVEIDHNDFDFIDDD